MATTSAFAEIAALVGDPARAAMLAALMGGRALCASAPALSRRAATAMTLSSICATVGEASRW